MKARYYSLILISLFILGSIPQHIVAPDASSKVVVFDYSHGQRSTYVAFLDQMLAGNLTEMGYTTIFATGGLNSSILSTADGLIIGSIYGIEDGFTADEVNAISSWYNVGGKFMWVGYDSDYAGLTYINDNMTQILDAVNSHVYGEPTSIEDAVSNCGGADYRPVATGTSSNSKVSATGTGVSGVLMHGPTLLYGSSSANPDVGIALETQSIPNVYPILYYSSSACITDADLIPPKAHSKNQEGAFVAATIELGMGANEKGVVVAHPWRHIFC